EAYQDIVGIAQPGRVSSEPRPELIKQSNFLSAPPYAPNRLSSAWKPTEAGKKITSPARVDATSTFLSDLQANRAGMGEFDKLTKGSQTDSVLNIAKSIVTDAQKGMTFDSLKAARTHVGQLAADAEDRVLKNHLDGLYASLTSDMEKTAVASGDDALSSFKTANDHFKGYIDPVTGFGKGSEADSILKKNTDDILNWSMSGAKNGR
ncbi:hypothetical protein FHW37_1111, partial [Neorhizobium alkalisoli]